jgi:hypothetical protein
MISKCYYKCGMGALNDAQTKSHAVHHEKNCLTSKYMPFHDKIDLETNYRHNIPLNVPIPFRHASQCFFTILNVVLIIHTYLAIS